MGRETGEPLATKPEAQEPQIATQLTPKPELAASPVL